MKIKQNYIKKLSLIFIFALALTGLNGVIFNSQASALTQKEWKECQDRYKALQISAGANTKQKNAWSKFLESKCYVDQGGNCTAISKGSGSGSYQQADCPLSDKYLDQKDQQDEDAAAEGEQQMGASGTNECGGIATSILSCGGSKDASKVEDTGIWHILIVVLNIMTGMVALAAVGGIAYAAILYTTAEDKSAQVQKAKETIFGVIVGLVLFASMYAILQFLIPGGIF